MTLIDIASPLLELTQQVDSSGVRRQPPTMPASVLKLASEILVSAKQTPEEFANDLYQSLLLSSARTNRISLAVTGLAWLGAGVPSVQQEMMAIIGAARREITLCSYSITAGAAALFDELAVVASQGVLVTLIINNLRSQPSDIREKLRSRSPVSGQNLKLFDFSGPDLQQQLHAKVIVADRAVALVGSANMSFHGMVSNHELAVVLRGPVAEEIASRMDSLRTAAKEVSPQSL